MNISEVRSFVKEHDWRIMLTAVGLAVIAFLPSPADENTVIDFCMDQATQGADGIAEVRAGNVTQCYNEIRQESVSPLTIYPSVSGDIR